MCTTTLTYVQLWRHVGPANSTTYELLYQWNFHPSTLSEYTVTIKLHLLDLLFINDYSLYM